MKKPALNVFVDRQCIGRLVRSDVEEDTILFGYRDGAPAASAVSLTMPIRADQYDSMAGLLPIFEMNLPEGALKERLRLQFAKAIPEFDDLDLLSIVGSSQIGRLRYSQQDAIDAVVPEQDLTEILTYTGAADLFVHLLERFATYSGVSGIQPKVLVRQARAPDKLTHRGATHIVKAFDPAEYPELAANEFICMSGAAAAGIRTARVQLSENRRFLIVDRGGRQLSRRRGLLRARRPAGARALRWVLRAHRQATDKLRFTPSARGRARTICAHGRVCVQHR
jgi:serine/threonine-protein kinase HipA